MIPLYVFLSDLFVAENFMDLQEIWQVCLISIPVQQAVYLAMTLLDIPFEAQKIQPNYCLETNWRLERVPYHQSKESYGSWKVTSNFSINHIINEVISLPNVHGLYLWVIFHRTNSIYSTLYIKLQIFVDVDCTVTFNKFG